MCQGGNPLYKVAQFDSRNLLQLGKALGIKSLEQEAQYNIKNPGHAISTAAEYALGGYLGSAAAGALGGGAGAAADSAGPALTAAYGAATPGLSLTGEQAAMLAAQTGEFGSQGLLSTAAAGGSPLANMVTGQSLGSGGKAGGLLAQELGSRMMQPPPQQPTPQGRPFMPQQEMPPNTGNAAFAPVQQPQSPSLMGQKPSDLEREKLLAQLRARGYPV